MAVLKSDDDRVTFYLTPLAVEFEDEEPRWLEYELGFRVALEQGADLVTGSEGLSLSLMESELTELISRLHRLIEALPGGPEGRVATVRYEGTDPDFTLKVTAEPAPADEAEAEPARASAPTVSVRVEVWVDLSCFQGTTSAERSARGRAGFQFATSPRRLEQFVERLQQEFEQASGREFIRRQESPLPAEVPFSRILNLLNRKDWSERYLAVRLLERVGQARSIALLIQTLDDRNGWVRERAAAAAAQLTGETFDFDAFAHANERLRAIRRWQSWWQTNRLAYVTPKAGRQRGDQTGS